MQKNKFTFQDLLSEVRELQDTEFSDWEEKLRQKNKEHEGEHSRKWLDFRISASQWLFAFGMIFIVLIVFFSFYFGINSSKGQEALLILFIQIIENIPQIILVLLGFILGRSRLEELLTPLKR